VRAEIKAAAIPLAETAARFLSLFDSFAPAFPMVMP
jgi:hypothetical protein